MVVKASVASSDQKHTCKKTEHWMLVSSCPRVPTSVTTTLHVPEFKITVITKTPEYRWHGIFFPLFSLFHIHETKQGDGK